MNVWVLIAQLALGVLAGILMAEGGAPLNWRTWLATGIFMFIGMLFPFLGPL